MSRHALDNLAVNSQHLVDDFILRELNFYTRYLFMK